MWSVSFWFAGLIWALPGDRRQVLRARPGCGRVHSGGPWGLSGALGFLQIIQRRPGDRRGHSGLLGSFLLAKGVDEFIYVHSDASWRSLC